MVEKKSDLWTRKRMEVLPPGDRDSDPGGRDVHGRRDSFPSPDDSLGERNQSVFFELVFSM